MFPNPNSGSFSIVSSNEKEILNITIKEISGKTLLNEQVLTENYVYLLNPELKGGVYFITIENGNSERIIKKVIVNK